MTPDNVDTNETSLVVVWEPNDGRLKKGWKARKLVTRGSGDSDAPCHTVVCSTLESVVVRFYTILIRINYFFILFFPNGLICLTWVILQWKRGPGTIILSLTQTPLDCLGPMVLGNDGGEGKVVLNNVDGG
jgi:hypothetical protein